jgi:hypothetical protein
VGRVRESHNLGIGKGRHDRLNKSGTAGHGGMPGYSPIQNLTGWMDACASSGDPSVMEVRGKVGTPRSKSGMSHLVIHEACMAWVYDVSRWHKYYIFENAPDASIKAARQRLPSGVPRSFGVLRS